MSDLDNLQALKRMLEHKDEEEAQGLMEREKKFIADATRAYLNAEGMPVTTIQGYDPEKMLAFLSRPYKEVQQLMGGEWAELEPMAFEAMMYTINKKIQKSTSLLDWTS